MIVWSCFNRARSMLHGPAAGEDEVEKHGLARRPATAGPSSRPPLARLGDNRGGFSFAPDNAGSRNESGGHCIFRFGMAGAVTLRRKATSSSRLVESAGARAPVANRAPAFPFREPIKAHAVKPARREVVPPLEIRGH